MRDPLWTQHLIQSRRQKQRPRAPPYTSLLVEVVRKVVRSDYVFHSLTILRQAGIRAIIEGFILEALKDIVRARVACLITENMIKLL